MHKFPVRFGKFILLEQLGRGGMANVFRAATLGPRGFSKIVALKQIRADLNYEPEFIEMFANEANILSLLNHQNICHTYDFGSHEDIYFLAMEYISGPSLSQLNRALRHKDQKLDIKYVLRIIKKICAGLHYAHNLRTSDGQPLRLVHRDLKPGNVLISEHGGVKIIDFGVAKSRNRSSITQVGLLKGTFCYMSPEQAQGESLDHRSDLFTVGLLMHELLTGQKVYVRNDKYKASIKDMIRADIEPPSKINPEVDSEIDRIVMKALAREPEDRYQSVKELGDALSQYINAHKSKVSCTKEDLKRFVLDIFRDAYDRERQKVAYFASINFNEVKSDFIAPQLNFGPDDSSDFSSIYSRFGYGLSSIHRMSSATQYRSNSRSSSKKKPKPILIPMISFLAMFSILIISGWFFMFKYFEKDRYDQISNEISSTNDENGSKSREKSSDFQNILLVRAIPNRSIIHIFDENNKEVALDQNSTPLVITNLELNRRYLIKVSFPGYIPFEREIIWNEKSQTNLFIKLKEFMSVRDIQPQPKPGDAAPTPRR